MADRSPIDRYATQTCDPSGRQRLTGSQPVMETFSFDRSVCHVTRQDIERTSNPRQGSGCDVPGQRSENGNFARVGHWDSRRLTRSSKSVTRWARRSPHFAHGFCGARKRGRIVLLAAPSPSSSVLPRSDSSKVAPAWPISVIDGGNSQDTCFSSFRASSTVVLSKTLPWRGVCIAFVRRSRAIRTESPSSDATKNGNRDPLPLPSTTLRLG